MLSMQAHGPLALRPAALLRWRWEGSDLPDLTRLGELTHGLGGKKPRPGAAVSLPG